MPGRQSPPTDEPPRQPSNTGDRVSVKGKGVPTRSRLTWDEIRKIESSWSSDAGPAREDIKKLVRHIRFVEHLLAGEQKSGRSKT